MTPRLAVTTAALFGVAVGTVVVVQRRIALDVVRPSPTRRPRGPS